MKLSDAALYLVGQRSAILRIAACRWSLVIGVLLVFSGSLARNYDGAYLVAEWGVLLHGVAVSVGNSLVLFTLMYVVMRLRKGVVPRFFSGYLCFLGLFWMTSPMAWVYAVPYERWLEPVEAIRANLNTLLVISIWRVALMTRVLSVIFKARVLPTFFIVMLFSDVAVLIGAIYSPVPLIDFMGGMHHSPVDDLLVSVNLATRVFGMLSLPVWAVGFFVGLAWMRGGEWRVDTSRLGRAPRAMLAAAIVSLLAWVVPLMYTQPEQKNRWIAERLLRSGQVREALTMMSALPRDAFPPIWDAPPRVGYGEREPSLKDVAEAITAASTENSWVISIYIDKSRRHFFSLRGGAWLSVADAIMSTDYHGSKLLEDRMLRLQMHLRFDTTLTLEDRVEIERAVQYLAKQPREKVIEEAK